MSVVGGSTTISLATNGRVTDFGSGAGGRTRISLGTLVSLAAEGLDRKRGREACRICRGSGWYIVGDVVCRWGRYLSFSRVCGRC